MGGFHPPAKTGLKPIEVNQGTISTLLSPWSSMQSPFQVPPVPKLVFILLSKLARIGAFTLRGKPAIVVTVLPPRPLFSRLTSKRSPPPTHSSCLTLIELPCGMEAWGRPEEANEENGESPKLSVALTGLFLSSRPFRLIPRKLPSPALRRQAKAGLFRSFGSQGNASILDVIGSLGLLGLHPTDIAKHPVHLVELISDSLSLASNF
jgi:hypothetical protein